MKKLILRILIIFFTFCIVLFGWFYYEFFLKPISKEDAGIIECSSLLIIENHTKSKLYAVLNFNFLKEEIDENQNEYIIANDYFLKDTIMVGRVGDYSNSEVFNFSGFKGKPEILPNNFSLSILDSSKQILKNWTKDEFMNNIKIKNYNERSIKITIKNKKYNIK